MIEYNLYCDESCHLEHDNINVMVLGTVWCPKDKLSVINQNIKNIKLENSIPFNAELKWSKVAPVKKKIYEDMINYFFDDKNLHFRGLLIPDKSLLNHAQYNQTHDEWYYKMYFDLLKVMFNPTDTYNIYIDIKDSNSNIKSSKLHEYISNSMYDFSRKIVHKIQPIRSEEVQIMQLTDILIGALGYNNRIFPQDFHRSDTKMSLIELIKKRSGYALNKSTLFREDKFNIFKWKARV